MTARRARLLDGLDLQRLEGIEIGALADPVVRREDGRVLYVDHADTPSLRAKYAAHGAVDPDRLVEVDAVWGAASLAGALSAAGVAGRVDYVVASHVAEHVPDLLGWLGELHEVLRPGGTVRLAVPDRRFTFDCLRRESRLSDLVHASLLGARRPLPVQILDHVLEVATYHPDRLAAGVDPDEVPRLHGLELAVGAARDALNGGYHDVHCWVFTPLAFASLLGRAARLGLHRFGCVWLDETVAGSNEFLACLVDADEPEGAAASWRPVVERLRARAASIEDEGRRSAEREAVAAATARSEARAAALEASTSWRLTAPLRAVSSRLRWRARQG